ncbi:MAG: hypothetical protein WAN35_08015 [Terracidiphilus sp.]
MQERTVGGIGLAWLMTHMIQDTGAAQVAFSPDELKELNASVLSIQNFFVSEQRERSATLLQVPPQVNQNRG